MQEAPHWPARFALLDRLLPGRLREAEEPAPQVQRAWELLRASDGAVEIAALAPKVGWSRRHLAERFRIDVGLPPKSVARILRFARVTRTLRSGAGAGLADVAYAYQAHLNRDFRELAGTTPTACVARLLPDEAGVAGSDLPNVQDALVRAA